MKTTRSVEKGAKLLGAMAAGAAVGYAAGMLTAPASGAETRRRAKRRVEDGALNAKLAVTRKVRKVQDAITDVASRDRSRSV